ncbi:MAG: c-type cytochrome, partial [Parvularculaceae bacterium]|nr:c-type cytochrome [Parvularculaceae bacterium]
GGKEDAGASAKAAPPEVAAPAETAAIVEVSAPAAPLDLPGRLAAANLANGGRQFIQCRACHTLEQDGAHLTGPNLWGIENAKAGSKAGFEFSTAVAESGITWTKEELDAFIKSPNDVIPGSKMIFRGISDDQKRADLLSYLLNETSPATASE